MSDLLLHRGFYAHLLSIDTKGSYACGIKVSALRLGSFTTVSFVRKTYSSILTKRNRLSSLRGKNIEEDKKNQ